MLNIMFIFVELKLLFNVPIDMHEGTNKISRKKKCWSGGNGKPHFYNSYYWNDDVKKCINKSCGNDHETIGIQF